MDGFTLLMALGIAFIAGLISPIVVLLYLIWSAKIP